jgi:serine/threonine protein kinase
MAMEIARKVADAVNYMHSHNPIIIHQDLKPKNILAS